MSSEKEQNIAPGVALQEQPGSLGTSTKTWREYLGWNSSTSPPEPRQPIAPQLHRGPRFQGYQTVRFADMGYVAQNPEAVYHRSSSMKFLIRLCRGLLLANLILLLGWSLFNLFVVGRLKSIHQSEKSRREVTGYGEYPGLTVTPFMSAPGDMNATATDYLTTLSHSHVIVPVTVEAPTTVSSSVGTNATQLVNSTALSVTATVSMSSGIPNATVTFTGSESEHSYPTKTTLSEVTGRPTSWYFGNSTSSSQYAGTGTGIGTGTGLFTATSVSDVTVTVIPIPVLTTGATAAMNISGSASSSSSCSESDISVGVHNTTSTRPTVYQTVTETWTSDNCTLEASKTYSASKEISSTVTTTAGTDAMFTSTSGALKSSTQAVATPVSQLSSSSSETYTSTETETVTPIVTLEKTTSVSETVLGTITIHLSQDTTVTQIGSVTGIPTSSAGTCGAKETETTTVVIFSTVYANSTSTETASTSTISTSSTSTSTVASTTESSTSYVVPSAVPYTYESSQNLTMMTSTMTSTSTSTISLNTTQTVSIGSNTTSTYGVKATSTSSSSTPCTHTVIVTASPNSTVSAAHSSSVVSSNTTSVPHVTAVPKVSSSSTTDDSGFVVSTLISTMITTYSLHPHSVMDISTQSYPTASTSAIVTFHPFAVNGTGNGTSNSNTSVPENIPLGPASPDGVVPLNFTISGHTTPPRPTSSAIETSGANSKAGSNLRPWDQENSVDTLTCIVMLSTAVAIIMSI
ncbi:hypothetical protein GL218_01561 [Daldinia childiae]|uniref:uncharacterized protein n=1 Tax=Daldinia childiae TaxID=326645 RepID=UPI001445E0D5|nr:uncharacterized protein GL218_01561 [Daldinia childiae]KAF3064051.1 hypothetical protein GL218_01561 [Daldinia childiae]